MFFLSQRQGALPTGSDIIQRHIPQIKDFIHLPTHAFNKQMQSRKLSIRLGNTAPQLLPFYWDGLSDFDY